MARDPLMRNYERDAVTAITAPFRRKPGISDSDVAGEYRAMAILKTAYPQFVSLMQDAAALSDIKRNDIHDALAVLADAMPGFEAWSEALDEAKNSYD